MPRFILTSHAAQRWTERVGAVAPELVLEHAIPAGRGKRAKIYAMSPTSRQCRHDPEWCFFVAPGKIVLCARRTEDGDFRVATVLLMKKRRCACAEA
jgi:hypothetical protein